jgi:hypothetical protein
MVEYVNHPPCNKVTDDDWKFWCKEWVAAMKHPGYLQIGGRPVFKVHGLRFFNEACGNDLDKVASRIKFLRGLCKDSGLADPLVGASSFGDKGMENFDFNQHYMLIPPKLSAKEVYPFSKLIDYAEGIWGHYTKTHKEHYVPCLPAGWDPRPWGYESPSFKFPTSEEWVEALTRVNQALNSNEKLGIPTKGGRQKIFVIYAWNEFGEGGIIAPTKGEKNMKLEGIKKVFAGK